MAPRKKRSLRDARAALVSARASAAPAAAPALSGRCLVGEPVGNGARSSHAWARNDLAGIEVAQLSDLQQRVPARGW